MLVILTSLYDGAIGCVIVSVDCKYAITYGGGGTWDPTTHVLRLRPLTYT